MGICGQAINEEQKHKKINNINKNEDKFETKKQDVKIGNNKVVNNNVENTNNVKYLNNLGNRQKKTMKEIKINDNLSISKEDYNNDSISFPLYITKASSIFQEENITFPKGEQHYKLLNKNYQIKNVRTKLLLSFYLKDIKNPKDNHSFGISIINNKCIGNKTFLGKLENKKGENIEYDKSFEIDYIFESEQILIIEPIINDIKIEVKKELNLITLIVNKNYELLIENIGILKISCAKLEKNKMEDKLFEHLEIKTNDKKIGTIGTVQIIYEPKKK